MPRLKSREDVRRFLRMVTYYSRFIHRASTITTPLRHLLCKNTIFKWTSVCEVAFLKLKQANASDQVLVPYDRDLLVQLACDASPTWIAGVLSHIVDGHEHPIAFASRLLTAAEQNYSQYLFGRHFKLVTDNQPLTHIFNHRAALKKMTAGRLQRYAAFLSGFNYTIDFKKGIENSNVDCLCQAPININKETKKDATLSTIMKSLQEENTSEQDYIIESGILFRGQRVVVPACLQSAFLNELNRTHVGITKMKQLARRYLSRTVQPRLQVILREEPEHNWQQTHTDYAGPYQDHHFLVVVDAKSNWAKIVPCSSAPTSKSRVKILKDIFSRNGFPEVMVLDNAAIFTSEEFAQFYKEASIFQKFCAAGHPATNGLAERSPSAEKSISNHVKPIRQKVREIIFRYRATPLSNGKSPAEQYLN
ncbi:hypothetical protein PR048_007465 [Dryococelus australis]|uniref:Integrase catalytic domain-containing protein n=1 Tax=Dryococelus australis TaxID=614101 RepID=A0ABQ9HV86_9NEOP|nr:hypothetical protein PR048_007465 [Dryococelus australis]